MHALNKTYASLLSLLGLAVVAVLPRSADADWNGLTDASDALQTGDYAFSGSHPDQVNGNENYYDGDLGDFDGDGVIDRALGSRYGLLMNTGGGLMTPFNGRTGFLLRGMPGAQGWGEDAFQWADVDNDGDLDNLSGGNGEPLTLQTNRAGRFSTTWQLSNSALNIVNTDVEGDGDVDLVVAHSFCSNSNCGGPVQFALLINDGTGTMSEQSVARGLDMSGFFITGVVSGDVDDDGDYDLLIQRGDASTPGGVFGYVQVALNDGGGNYTLSATDVPINGSGFGQGFNLGDIDDDGDLDIVMTSRRPGSVYHSIGINDGTGAFSDDPSRWDDSAATRDLEGGNSALFDLDYDGDLDYIALETDPEINPTGFHRLHVFLNDGSGTLVYNAEHSVDYPANGSALGADTDIADLDRDGDYDIWVGMGGDRVRIMLNDFEADDGLPADVPRDLEVTDSGASGVTLRWSLPSFASNSTYYKVWRATSPGLADRDRELIAIIGERHQDEALAAPVTRHSDASRLGPGVQIDADAGTISYTDTTALPGQTYQYSVSHVGAENSESVQAPEVFTVVPDGNEEGSGPTIALIAPTQQDWWSYPRVVAHFADGGSGVDPDSVRVTFDTDLGDPAGAGIAAGEDATDFAYRLDAGAVIVPLEPPHTFPNNSLVTMTVEAADMDGNISTAEETFFVSPVATTLPTASASASATSGAAPFVVDFDASASSDADGKLLRWEWYFGDGTTATGRVVSHEFASGGTFDVKLLVRDNDGGVAVDTVTIDVDGEPADCTLGEVRDCYGGPEGSEDLGICVGGSQQCGPAGWGECQGEVLPETEVCDDGVDNDCDGDVDDVDTDCGGPGGSDTDSGGGSDGPETGGASMGGETDSAGPGSQSATAASSAGGGDTDTDGDGGQDSDAGCGCRSTSDVDPFGLLLLGGVFGFGFRRRR